MANTTIKSVTTQIIEVPVATISSTTAQVATSISNQASLVAAQAMFNTPSTVSATATTKLLILGAPAVATVKSVTVQVIEGPDTNPAVTSVTGQVAVTTSIQASLVAAQAMFSPIPVTISCATNKLLILEPTRTITTNNVKVEVIGVSTIIPPVPGQQTVWFNNS